MDKLTATSAFSALRGSAGQAQWISNAIQITELLGQGLVRLQGPGADMAFNASVAESIGICLPQTPCTSTGSDELRCLWLNPREWLLITSETEEISLTQKLDACCGDYNALVTLNTDTRCGMRIEGDAAEQLLAKGCTLDFHPSGFPVGKCTITRFNSLPVILLRTTNTCFDFYVDRALVEHAWHWLVDASIEFGS